MAKPALGPKNEGRLEIPACSTNNFYFVLDLYVKNKPLRCVSVSMNDKIHGRLFQKHGCLVLGLKDPVVLGNMKCFLQKHRRCRCSDKCINGPTLSDIRCSLSLFRGADHVSIVKAKSSRFQTRNPLHHSKITFDGEEGKYKKEEDSKLKPLLSLISVHVNENGKPKKYEDQGLSLRRTTVASEIRRRVNYNPIGISAMAVIDILPCGKKYGIVKMGFSIMYAHLIQREDGNIQGYSSSGLFIRAPATNRLDLEGVTPFHILEELQSSDSLP